MLELGTRILSSPLSLVLAVYTLFLLLTRYFRDSLSKRREIESKSGPPNELQWSVDVGSVRVSIPGGVVSRCIPSPSSRCSCVLSRMYTVGMFVSMALSALLSLWLISACVHRTVSSISGRNRSTSPNRFAGTSSEMRNRTWTKDTGSNRFPLGGHSSIAFLSSLPLSASIFSQKSSIASSSSFSLVPLIPGVTLPWREVLPALLAILCVAFWHEIGHAICAIISGYKVDDLGLLLWHLLPFAFVHVRPLHTNASKKEGEEETREKRCRDVLFRSHHRYWSTIASAGPIHNLLLFFVVFGILIIVPLFSFLFYRPSSHLQVTAVPPNSPFFGVISAGESLIEIDGHKVSSSLVELENTIAIMRSRSKPVGRCLSSLSPADCCFNGSLNAMDNNFVRANPVKKKSAVESQRQLCVSRVEHGVLACAGLTQIRSAPFCDRSADCVRGSCFWFEDIRLPNQLLLIVRRRQNFLAANDPVQENRSVSQDSNPVHRDMADREDNESDLNDGEDGTRVLFVGNPTEVLRLSFVTKISIFPSFVETILQSLRVCLEFILLYNLMLFLVNLLPCPLFDGFFVWESFGLSLLSSKQGQQTWTLVVRLLSYVVSCCTISLLLFSWFFEAP